MVATTRQPETNAGYAAEIPAEQIQLIDSPTAQKDLVEAGFGLALMLASRVDDELRSGTLATIPTVVGNTTSSS